MILDDLSNASLYHGLHPSLKEAFDFLEQADLKGLAPGRHAICGERVFVGVDEYQTKKQKLDFGKLIENMSMCKSCFLDRSG